MTLSTQREAWASQKPGGVTALMSSQVWVLAKLANYQKREHKSLGHSARHKCIFIYTYLDSSINWDLSPMLKNALHSSNAAKSVQSSTTHQQILRITSGNGEPQSTPKILFLGIEKKQRGCAIFTSLVNLKLKRAHFKELFNIFCIFTPFIKIEHSFPSLGRVFCWITLTKDF